MCVVGVLKARHEGGRILFKVGNPIKKHITAAPLLNFGRGRNIHLRPSHAGQALNDACCRQACGHSFYDRRGVQVSILPLFFVRKVSVTAFRVKQVRRRRLASRNIFV